LAVNRKARTSGSCAVYAVEIGKAGPAVDEDDIKMLEPGGAQGLQPRIELVSPVQLVPIEFLDQLAVVGEVGPGHRHQEEFTVSARQGDRLRVGVPGPRDALLAVFDEIENACRRFWKLIGEVVIEAGCFDIEINDQDAAAPLRQDDGNVCQCEASSDAALVRIESNDRSEHHSAGG